MIALVTGPPAAWAAALLVQEALEGGVLGGVVGGAVLPAAPDDVDPGAGEDAHGVRVVLTVVPGLS
jgi:hypothetical protein